MHHTIDRPLASAPLWARCVSWIVRCLPFGRYRALTWINQHARSAAFVAQINSGNKGPKFVCDLSDRIACEVCLTGFYDPQETILIQHLLQPGMTFVDVGANWGYFTLLAAAQVGATGRVVAFEPHPKLFSLLKTNAELNAYHWITPVERAVASEAKTMELASYTAAEHNRGTSRLTIESSARVPTMRVECVQLDAALSEINISTVDLLKIDIEGGEALVIPSLRSALNAGRYRQVLLELHPGQLAEYHTNASALTEVFFQAGYRAWQLDHAPEIHRQLSYRLSGSSGPPLKPFAQGMPLDHWPHLLLIAPGEPEPFTKAP